MATVTDLTALEDIHNGLAAKDLTPGEHCLDTGYVTVDVIARAAQQSVRVIGPVVQDSSWQAMAGRGFDEASFQVDWNSRIAVCTTGQRSVTWHDQVQSHGTGAGIPFADTDCATCPVRADCTCGVAAGRSLYAPDDDSELTNGTTSTVQIAEHICLWHGTWRIDTVRVILLRETGRNSTPPSGYHVALITTDLHTTPEAIITRYAARWLIEVTFFDVKNIPGVGQARNRVAKAVERTVPFGLFATAS